MAECVIWPLSPVVSRGLLRRGQDILYERVHIYFPRHAYSQFRNTLSIQESFITATFYFNGLATIPLRAVVSFVTSSRFSKPRTKFSIASRLSWSMMSSVSFLHFA